MSTTATRQGTIVRRDQGKSVFIPDMRVELKAPGLIEFDTLPGCEIPLHVHRSEDELQYILEGSATYQIGDKTFEADPGSLIFLPRQVPHRLVFGAAGGRWLWLTNPMNDGLLDELGVPVDQADGPLDPESYDWERAMKVFAKYGMDFLETEEG